jgi:hypothetical protein
VKHDVEEDGRLPNPEQGLEEDKVTGAADRKKLRQPLNNTEKNGLEDTNLKSPFGFFSTRICVSDLAGHGKTLLPQAAQKCPDARRPKS